MLQIVGTVADVQIENKPGGPTWEPFVSTTFVMRSLDGNTRYVNKGRAFAGAEPQVGDHVTLGVFAGAYMKKDGTPAVQLTAHTNLTSSVPAHA